MPRARWVVLACLVGCGVRAPSRIDVERLLAARGPVEARRDLVIRVAADPRDVGGLLALAALDERLGRPSDSLAALERVEALGGPLGVRWHADDRARLGRLIAARGRARLARGAATAEADLERARRLGAPVTDDELRGAQIAGALAAVHHSDAETRARGRRALAAASSAHAVARPGTNSAEPPGGPIGDAAAWLGARAEASPAERGRFGEWLWHDGARRAAWEELSAWHAATQPPRDPALQQAYLVAARWWLPLDRPGPPAADLVGPARCGFVACSPRDVVGDEAAERALLTAPLPPPARDPADATALASITLHQALRGEASWGAALAARVDMTAFADATQLAALPRYAQPVFAQLTGRAAPAPGDAANPEERLLIAAQRALAGASAGDVAALAGSVPYAGELCRIVAPRPRFTGDALAEAVTRHASLASLQAASALDLRPIVVAYRRDPLIADRLGRDAVAAAIDAAAMHATLGALFDALGDPARARAAWQAAVDASPEPTFLRGLAEAQSRQGDGDAALISATAAAAASGDPAVVWTSVARALAGSGRYVHALDAARSAIDLSGPETIVAALEVAIIASTALGRDTQVQTLAAQRARFVPTGAPLGTDPSDARGALDAYQRAPAAAELARLRVASQWNPRDVALRAVMLRAMTADDPRRAEVTGELVELAGDRDPEVRRAAVAALR